MMKPPKIQHEKYVMHGQKLKATLIISLDYYVPTLEEERLQLSNYPLLSLELTCLMSPQPHEFTHIAIETNWIPNQHYSIKFCKIENHVQPLFSRSSSEGSLAVHLLFEAIKLPKILRPTAGKKTEQSGGTYKHVVIDPRIRGWEGEKA